MAAPDDMELGLGSALEKEPSAEPESGGDEGDLDAIEMDAAGAVMSAAKSGDARAFRDALKDFIHLCYPGD